MSLFQKTVIDNYLSKVKDEDFDTNWNTFKDYYLKEDTQERIKLKKEEEFQHDFLEFIFDNCLDYNIKDSADQNLFKEVKNVTDSKKADGAIRQGEDIVAVIELKSIKTKDFNEIQKQAFGYKNNHPNCRYVVSSNFQKLRFYIDDATKFEEFDLFKLNKEEFKLLWVCLAKDNLFDGVAKKLKSESILEEESITKKLYKDYSEFRKEIFNNLVESNPEIDKLTLFKKTQKLLDRFLFIFFAEDRGLVPTNSISKIIDQWEDSFTGSDSLYTVFKQYFNLLNEGRPKRGDKEAVFAYNGGLFATDDVLNTIKIDDDLLFKHTKNLSHYDFRSEISVDILGHIFEHSLSEIEEIQKEIGGEEVEKSKRKKDGIFYTPAYITKYMVENTLGKLCNEKKKELEINEDNYSDPKRRTKVRIKNLDSYREWLLDLKICDPACGSGAFLNQTLNFLIDEHTYIDNLKNTYLGGSIPFSDIENSILENNIYGVDINEESVEIAKLSLWLRTAQKERKLTSLSNNIKCGNSLIDEPINEDEGYFKWEKEFPKVFEKGGFDVVLGNPPYVRQELIQEYSEYLKKYKVYSGKGDLFTFFFEKGHQILKSNGYLCFISSGKFFEASYGKPLVDFLISNLKFEEIINFDDLEVFEGISAYPLIFNGRKKIENNYCFNYCFVPDCNFSKISDVISNLPFIKISNTDFIKNEFKFYSPDISGLFNKLNDNSIYLEELNCLPLVGVKTGFNDGFITKSKDISFSKPYVFGRNIKKYLTPDLNSNIFFPYEKNGDEYELISEDNLASGITFLENQREKLEKRAIIKDGIKNGTKKWYEYQQINKKLDFDSKYIIYPNVSLGTNFTFSKGNIVDMTGFIIPSDDKFLLSLLNSKVCQFVMRKTAITRRGNYQEYKLQYLEKIPLKMISVIEKEPFVKKVDEMILLTDELHTQSNKFQRTIQRKFEIDKLPKKLQDWYLLSFDDFIKELNKKKINLSLSEESEWEEFFNKESMKALEILNSISEVDKEIDKMVYDLYGLTKEEIEIIENS